MQVAVTAAIITGIFGIIVALIAKLVPSASEKPTVEFPGQKKDRLGALGGLWLGTANQPRGPDGNHVQYPIRMDLTVKNRVVSGSSELHVPYRESQQVMALSLRASYWRDPYIEIDYENQDTNEFQFGTMLYELSDTGRELSGQYVGYGSLSGRIVTGTVRLSKGNANNASQEWLDYVQNNQPKVLPVADTISNS